MSRARREHSALTPRRARPGPGALNSCRGVLLAGCSAGLATTAHALAGGGSSDAVPAPLPTLLLTALIGWVSTALAERSTGRLGTLAVLGSGQLVMHLVLTVLMVHPGPHPVRAAPLGGWSMTAAHAGATLGTALLLAHADTMIRIALAGLRLLLPVRWLPSPVPGSAPATAPVRAPVTEPVGLLLCRVGGLRGPPLLS